MIYPDFKTFLKLTQKGNIIPVSKEVMGDLDTPVSAFFKICNDAPHSFLLESVEGEEKVARFSFLAKNPEMIFRLKGKRLEITYCNEPKKKKETQTISGNPLSILRDIMKKYTFVPVENLPPFCGGLLGYLGYDVVRFFEDIPDNAVDDLKLPDILLMLAKDIIIFDHLNHKIKIVSCVHIENTSPSAIKKEYSNALTKIDQLEQELNQPLVVSKTKTKTKKRTLHKIRSNFSEKAFCDIVTQAKRYIKAGDIIQTVLSQRFEVPLHTDAINIYRTLRGINPSPYMYYLKFDDIQIVGSSPELLVRCEDGIVETRPIAGTRPRGKNEIQDTKLKEELLADPKERAEHVMLVDLGRNDLGRVCKKGTVQVSEFMEVEKYSHVMHIVSNVTGVLHPRHDAFDVLQAAFPAGTVSGAPKIRAMEIIDELETVSRGPYAGCIGYFSFSGNLDSCITIRTVVVNKGKAYVQAGAGIVADSKPKKEYQETVNKAKAMVSSIETANNHT